MRRLIPVFPVSKIALPYAPPGATCRRCNLELKNGYCEHMQIAQRS